MLDRVLLHSMSCSLVLSLCGYLAVRSLGMRVGTFYFPFHSIGAAELQLREEVNEIMKVVSCWTF